MKKLLPVLLAVIGLGGGAVAGAMLKPAPAPVEAEVEDHAALKAKEAEAQSVDEAFAYVPLDKPFFAPVSHGSTNALVRIDLHIELPEDGREAVSRHEPKLRDAFLRTVMDFSERGGFARIRAADGFDILRDDLLLSARKVLGPSVRNVLIGEILTRNG